MVERFLKQTTFSSQEDYRKNLHIHVPENFNFAYDVVDAYAEEQPDRKALLWTNDQGAEIQFTFADMKRETDRTASFINRMPETVVSGIRFSVSYAGYTQFTGPARTAP